MHGDGAIAQAEKAITERRDAVQSLRISTIERNDLAEAIMARGGELAAGGSTERSAAFRVGVEGEPRELHPIVRHDIYKFAAETLRNAFRHAHALRTESRSVATTTNIACASVTMGKGAMSTRRLDLGLVSAAACLEDSGLKT